MIMKTTPIGTRIVISYAMKRASPFEFDGRSMETETTTWSKSPYGGKTIVEQIEQIIAWEVRNPKEQDSESHSQGSKDDHD